MKKCIVTLTEDEREERTQTEIDTAFGPIGHYIQP